MSKKRNAGQRAARANMASLHRDANANVKLDKALDDFIEKKRVEMEESVDTLLPLLPRGLGRAVGFGLNSMFGIQLMDPMAVAGISSVETGRRRSDEEAPREARKPASFGAPYGVPPLFAPRDNGHRQSEDDLEKLEKLISENTYAVPEVPRDKWGVPEWPEGTAKKDGRHVDAGEWGKLCFRTACQRPHAFFYNSGTYKHYCQKCADAIDRENMGGFKLHHLAEFEGQPAAA